MNNELEGGQPWPFHKFNENTDSRVVDDLTYNIRVKPITTAPKTPTIPQGRDTFETPNYAVDLLIPFIPKNIDFVWECAAGSGKIVNRLKHHGYGVYATDIRQNSGIDLIWNFVDPTAVPMFINYMRNMAIITNPPYSVKELFINRALEMDCPFAFLINANYSGLQINWIKKGCEKIIPNRRIDFITPTGRQGKTSASQFHSIWLTHGFNLGRTETFVELSLKEKKENI